MRNAFFILALLTALNLAPARADQSEAVQIIARAGHYAPNVFGLYGP